MPNFIACPPRLGQAYRCGLADDARRPRALQCRDRCREAIRWARPTGGALLFADSGPLAAYEPPATMLRDTCFQKLAYAMHDRGQCAKVEDKQLRVRCEVHIP